VQVSVAEQYCPSMHESVQSGGAVVVVAPVREVLPKDRVVATECMAIPPIEHAIQQTVVNRKRAIAVEQTDRARMFGRR
jgi:hypothetical protein